MELPEKFRERMKMMLGDEYPQFAASYDKPRTRGLRVNTLKITPEEFVRIAPFHLKKIPWVENGFYYEEEDRPSRHPYYFAGLYYLQEPSAMAPASRLEVRPGERVLDLCAAPGGKSTELGAQLKGQGILVSNDISGSRMKGLLKNIEMFGVANAFLTNEDPERLARCFPEYFDKILVDAPCSGEGMFRKEPAMVGAWTPEKPRVCAGMQMKILDEAVKMLRPGGKLLYSTCTFAPVENEGSISRILERWPELEPEDMLPCEGFAPGIPEWGGSLPGLEKTVRLWPHRIRGEGHYMALLQKCKADGAIQAASYGNPPECGKERRKKRHGPERKKGGLRLDEGQQKLFDDFFAHMDFPFPGERLEVRGSMVYMLPETDVPRGLSFVRNGLLVGELKKGRFEPSQPLAMAITSSRYDSCLNLAADDPRTGRYLKGETLQVVSGECARENGWQLVCVDGYPLGWGKLVNGILRNKYLSGWRSN
ncbi:MAG TPA: SAM-dependent methyltransferase [Lachnospiraceae bacterium]|nr:SAM-dependent methyltransferase [Lachnospiraceae bacterium]